MPGVAEVASVGGHVQQYQIDVDPNRLRTYNLPLSAVVSAVRDSNLNVGGNVLESNGAWLIVRGVGLITSVDDVKQIVVGASNGVPVYVEQVGERSDRQRVPRRVAGEGHARKRSAASSSRGPASTRRRSSTPSRPASRRSRRASRRASGSCRSTTART